MKGDKRSQEMAFLINITHTFSSSIEDNDSSLGLVHTPFHALSMSRQRGGPGGTRAGLLRGLEGEENSGEARGLWNELERSFDCLTNLASASRRALSH